MILGYWEGDSGGMSTSRKGHTTANSTHHRAKLELAQLKEQTTLTDTK